MKREGVSENLGQKGKKKESCLKAKESLRGLNKSADASNPSKSSSVANFHENYPACSETRTGTVVDLT